MRTATPTSSPAPIFEVALVPCGQEVALSTTSPFGASDDGRVVLKTNPVILVASLRETPTE